MKLIIYFVSLILAGCAAPSKKASSLSLFDGTSKLTSEKAAKELEREEMHFSKYKVGAMPFTEAYIRAQETEKGKKRQDTQEQIDANIKSGVKAFAGNDTCFSIWFSTMSIHTAKIEKWSAKIEDSFGNLHSLKFYNVAKNTGAHSVPTYSSGDLQGFSWYNSSTACGPKIDMTKPFKLHVVPEFDQTFPNSTLAWDIK